MPSTTVYVYGTEITVNRLLPNNSAEPFLIWVGRVVRSVGADMSCHLQGSAVIVVSESDNRGNLVTAMRRLPAAAAPFPIDVRAGEFLGRAHLVVRGVS